MTKAEEALRDAAKKGNDAEVQEGIAKGVDVNAGDSVSGRARQRESGEALCVGSIHPHAQHTSSDVLDRYKHRKGGGGGGGRERASECAPTPASTPTPTPTPPPTRTRRTTPHG